jgi:hypothetical protein
MTLHRMWALVGDDNDGPFFRDETLPFTGGKTYPVYDIGEYWPASAEAVDATLNLSPLDDDGRSPFQWFRLVDGTLILGVLPQGEGYFEVELLVAADYKAAGS